MFAALAVVVLIAAGAAFLVLRDGGDKDYSLGVMSTEGRPFEMAVPEQLFTPGSPKTTGEALLIAERSGIRLVRMPREDGSSCWGTSEHRSGEWQLTELRVRDAVQPLSGSDLAGARAEPERLHPRHRAPHLRGVQRRSPRTASSALV